MKKFFFFLLITVMTATAFAQPGRTYPAYPPPSQRSTGYSGSGFRTGDTYQFSYKQRDKAIKKIHKRYNKKIREVKNRWLMGRNRKDDEVNRLERERDMEIGRVNARFYNKRNRAYQPAPPSRYYRR